ncbi:MAG: divergent polysaccharide deacetylase family protein, partial [Microvirga sp.]
GHEVMLQVPMEPFDYPDSDPGPHTLTTRAKPQENLDKLHWALGRFTGYTGVVNFMGAKLTSDEAALAPILREIGGRGLVFLDDGSSSRSLVGAVAPSARAPAARADLVVDGTTQAEAVDRELGRLEEMAKKRGFAIGTASALPATVERILRWSRSLEAKGIQLVPVSSAYGPEGR